MNNFSSQLSLKSFKTMSKKHTKKIGTNIAPVDATFYNQSEEAQGAKRCSEDEVNVRLLQTSTATTDATTLPSNTLSQPIATSSAATVAAPSLSSSPHTTSSSSSSPPSSSFFITTSTPFCSSLSSNKCAIQPSSNFYNNLTRTGENDEKRCDLNGSSYTLLHTQNQSSFENSVKTGDKNFSSSSYSAWSSKGKVNSTFDLSYSNIFKKTIICGTMLAAFVFIILAINLTFAVNYPTGKFL